MKWFEYFQSNSPMHAGSRKLKDRWFGIVAAALHKVGITANHTTTFGALLAATSIALLLANPEKYYWWFVGLAFISWWLDGVDGTLARVYGEVSTFGKRFDYWVDVLVMFATYICFTYLYASPWWYLGLVVYVGLFIIHRVLKTGVTIFPGRSYVFVPSIFGLPAVGLFVFCLLVGINILTLLRTLAKRRPTTTA